MECIEVKNSVLNSCSYILDGDNKCLVIIDCGDIQPIIEYAEKARVNIGAVLLTHSHFDHIYGLNELIMRFPNIVIYTSYEGKIGLLDSKVNLSKYNEILPPFQLQLGLISIIEKNQSIQIGNLTIHAFLTPGHDTSCITYQFHDMLFTGDSLIPGIKTVTNLPRSNKQQAEYYENWIKNKARSEYLTIYPGHYLL